MPVGTDVQRQTAILALSKDNHVVARSAVSEGMAGCSMNAMTVAFDEWDWRLDRVRVRVCTSVSGRGPWTSFTLGEGDRLFMCGVTWSCRRVGSELRMVEERL